MAGPLPCRKGLSIHKSAIFKGRGQKSVPLNGVSVKDFAALFQNFHSQNIMLMGIREVGMTRAGSS